MPEATTKPDYSRVITTPAGPALATVRGGGVAGFSLLKPGADAHDEHPLLDALQDWLTRYTADPRTAMDLPLAMAGTDFERTVWSALLEIPAGETRTYAQIARSIAKPDAVRAVGRANGANPIALLVPCHRVIASDGTLQGYAGGLELKRRLLDHEGALSPLFS